MLQVVLVRGLTENASLALFSSFGQTVDLVATTPDYPIYLHSGVYGGNRSTFSGGRARWMEMPSRRLRLEQL